MLWWFDSRFRERLDALNIKTFAYKRYVDDANAAVSSIPLNMTLDLTQNKLGDRQDDISPDETVDKHTFDILRRIADSISPMMQWTIDVPSMHKDGCVPCLELKANRYMGDKFNKIHFKFYQKPGTRQTLVSHDFALSNQAKFSILVGRRGKKIEEYDSLFN